MTATDQADSRPAPSNEYPSWAPRFWHGMRVATWWRLLARNRFRIAPSRLHIAFGVSLFTPFNDLLAGLQSLVYGRRIRGTRIEQPPIFILGHWRSGTTLLHELLVMDPRFACPRTYQCFAPSHFLVSEKLMLKFGSFLVPKKRPMDEMQAGWELPQEDEFALMNLGVPTPYLRIAFPRSQAKALEYLTLEEVDGAALARWRNALQWFIQALTFRYPGQRLVLKSPPHTGRLAELAKMFPEAKFVHITRDPRKLYCSTLRLWNSLDDIQGLQPPVPEAELKKYVVECLQRMYAGFEKARTSIDPARLIDIRYEDLVADPMQTLRDLYMQLDLGDFSDAEARLSERLKDHGEYRPNQHRIDSHMEAEILQLWPDYARKYGYTQQSSGTSS